MNENKNNNTNTDMQDENDFPIDIKRDIVDILNDTPSLVRLGDKDYVVKNMRFYSVFRICRLARKLT